MTVTFVSRESSTSRNGPLPQNNTQKVDLLSFLFLFSCVMSVGVTSFAVEVIMEVCYDVILFS